MSDSAVCYYCGVETERPTIDHVIAQAWGGPNLRWNRVVACADCNNRKANHSYEYFTGEQKLPAVIRHLSGWDTTRDFVLAMNQGGDVLWQKLLRYEKDHDDRLRERERLARVKVKKAKRKSKKDTPPWWIAGYDKQV